MRKIKLLALVSGLLVPLSHSFADEPISVSGIPFQSVNYLSGRNSAVVFYEVKVKDLAMNVSVPVGSVEVVLTEDVKVYTTLNLINVERYYVSTGWLKAEKAVVVVRQEKHFVLWQNFLAKVKKEQELEKKKWLEPTLVLPPPVD